MILHVDFESRSTQELRGPKSVGLHNYSIHESTKVLMLGWAYDNEPVEVWQPHLGPMPSRLKGGLDNPKVEIAAFNSAFERNIFKYCLKIELPIERFQDPQASARYLSLPADLDTVGEVLGLPKNLAKDKRGKQLIDLFCKPHKKKKKKGEAEEWIFYDWNSHPKEWEEFVFYCGQDITAEREVMRREQILGVWPLPPLERQIWEFDQRCNDRGIPTDKTFVEAAYELADQEKKDTIKLNNQKTGLANSNSGTQLLAWAKTQGYDGKSPVDDKKYSLDKDVVKSQLKNNPNLTLLCREVLLNRQAAASTSYKKMSTILRQISPDGRIRNQFQYMGSSRCGRWAGTGLQVHNMAKPNDVFEDEENVDTARALIYGKEYEKIKELFGSVLLTVKYNIRTAFVAEQGTRFNVADLNAIETRVGAYIAGCQPLLDVFFQGKDPYLDFAVKMTQIPYEVLARDIKSKDKVIKTKAKGHRTIAKPGVLGCIYRMGAETLQAYAETFGLVLSLEECQKIVDIFRQSYREIEEMWWKIEEAIADVLKEGTVKVKRELGPNGCIKINKFIFNCNGEPRVILRIQLPSGRYLHYMDAAMELTKMPWPDRQTGGDVFRMSLCYAAQDQKTKQWSRVTSHGGKVFENIVQGTARDILAVKLLDFEAINMPVILHVHDEGVTETPDDAFSPGIDEMNEIMSREIPWVPGLPLGSEGFETRYYHK